MCSSGRNDIDGAGVRITLPHASGTTMWYWSFKSLSTHWRPSRSRLEHQSDNRTSVRGSASGTTPGTAIASGYVMVSGIHHAEFQIHELCCDCQTSIRYADGSFSFLNRKFYDVFLAARTDEWGDGNVQHAATAARLVL